MTKDVLLRIQGLQFLQEENENPQPVEMITSGDYYKRNGMYYETFDPDEILGKMKEGIADRQEMFVCSFKDEEVYSQAVQQMIEELLPQAAQNLAERYGLEQVRYTYAEDKVQYIFSVFWNYNE